MNELVQENDTTKADFNEEFANKNATEIKVHDADVQEIINMMKDDLNQVKLKSKNDETSLNDCDSSRKSSRTFDIDNYIIATTSSNNSEKETLDSSNVNDSSVNDEYNQIVEDANDTRNLSLNETEKTETYNYDFRIERTCCEDPDCQGCNADYTELEKTNEPEEPDEYDLEFKEDMSDPKYKEIVDFIEKAKHFGANALDLSKKGLNRIPKKLLELKHLQYIYLEGNNLKKLPKDFFLTFRDLRWLDLRNNNLVELPTLGLGDLENLRSLLLENNSIERLPDEIANARSLSAISVSDNPLQYPSVDVVEKGFKHIQQFLRGEMLKRQLATVNKNNRNLEELIKDAEDEYYEIQSITDDVWASDGEETARYSQASKHTKAVTPCDVSPKDTQNAEVEKKKLLNKRRNLPPVEIAVYKNEELEKALRNGNLEKYKKSKESIDAKLQKVNDYKVVDDFRTNLKAKQRENAYKRLVKGVDYVEPVYKAPFEVNEEHMVVMTNEERAFVDKKLHEQQIANRSLSPETMWRVEETRRARDMELEGKIIEYKNKLLARRSSKGRSSNPKNDRLQAAKDLKELKLIEKELVKRRSELQHNFRSFTGDVHYNELKKLDNKNNLAAILAAAKLPKK